MAAGVERTLGVEGWGIEATNIRYTNFEIPLEAGTDTGLIRECYRVVQRGPSS